MGGENVKRVATLYRVSTDKQLDRDDIPMQRKECEDFIKNKNGWTFSKEYLEKGVSGYKVSAADRDVLQEVLRDAANGLFDVLLVFSTDRIGRIADEYAPSVKALSKYVEVWSAAQGDITVRNHTDSLKAYVDGWQAEGESIKISLRTDAKHRQMVQEGVYRGGSAPYGYKLVLSGRYSERDTKQRKELYDLVIDEDEAEIVRKIFGYVLDNGWGGNRIAQHLNTKKTAVLSREGKAWSMATINYMLRNPIYKGYPAYGKNTQKNSPNKGKTVRQAEDKWILSETQVQAWVIIPEVEWDKVQRLRKSRQPHNQNGYEYNMPTKGKLYLVGFITCASCGCPLVTAHHQKSYTRKNGTQYAKTNLKYECSGKKRGLPCDGQRVYARDKIEVPVLEQVKAWLSQIKEHDFTEEIERKKNVAVVNFRKKVDGLRSKKAQLERDIATLENEIPKSLTGDSVFKPEMLVSSINRKTDELKAVEAELHTYDNSAATAKVEASDISALREAMPKWETLFEKADEDKKKMMLALIISSVKVSSDSITVQIRLNIEQFLGVVLGVHSRLNGERA